MASFSLEDFVGNGCLKALLPKLQEDGWDDVPTLKLMSLEDMNAINMTKEQKDALEIRSYLHDRALMDYSDKLETARKSLSELLCMSMADLSAQFGMKRGHAARFMDRTRPWASEPLPERRQTTGPSRNSSIYKRELSSFSSRKIAGSTGKTSQASDISLEQSISDLKIKEGHVFKGIVSSMPAKKRGCGCVQPPPLIENVAPLSAIENVSVQKITPQYKVGMERLVKTRTPPMKGSELWREKTAVILCIRRPGCIMCRAEAHQLYSRKPIFDTLGVQLFAIIHECLESEVKDFWPRYWGGVVIHDRGMEFFKALGGGKLLKDKFLSGFLLNPRAIANYKRAKAMGFAQNFNGEGEIKGGLFIVGRGKTGIAYQFIERNFGDWAPLPEVFEICSQLQNQQQLSQSVSIKSSNE